MSQGLHAGLAVHDHEGTGVGATAAEDILIHRTDVDGDDQTTKNVEQTQTDPDGGHGLRHRATGVLGFGCNKASVLATCHGKDAGRHDAEEAFEAVEEGRLGPVAEADGFSSCSTSRDDL